MSRVEFVHTNRHATRDSLCSRHGGRNLVDGLSSTVPNVLDGPPFTKERGQRPVDRGGAEVPV
jgi:hypothetical protein